METLPNEILVMVFERARGYRPTLRAVCRRWYDLVADLPAAGDSRVAPLCELARLGHHGLIHWVAAERCGVLFSKAELDSMLAGAARGGRLELCRELRGWGAVDFNEMLLGATVKGHRAVAELALEWGATELELMARAAAEHGHLGLLELARSRGACDFARMAKDAARSDRGEFVRLIRTWFYDSNAAASFITSSFEDAVLAGAAEGGHSELVDEALRRGARDFRQMMVDAAVGGQVRMIRRAFELAATRIAAMSADEAFKYFDRALCAAACYGHLEAVGALRALGATNPEPVLQGAALGGQRRMAEYARELGARDFEAMLEWSIREEEVEMATLAREWGAHNYNRMLIVAAQLRATRMVALAREWGATDLNSGLAAAAAVGDSEMVSMFVGWGATDFRGATLCAINQRRLNTLTELVKLWNPSAGWLLMYSSLNNFAEGATLARRMGGLTPIDVMRAIQCARQQGGSEVEALLDAWLTAAADPDSMD